MSDERRDYDLEHDPRGDCEPPPDDEAYFLREVERRAGVSREVMLQFMDEMIPLATLIGPVRWLRRILGEKP